MVPRIRRTIGKRALAAAQGKRKVAKQHGVAASSAVFGAWRWRRFRASDHRQGLPALTLPPISRTLRLPWATATRSPSAVVDLPADQPLASFEEPLSPCSHRTRARCRCRCLGRAGAVHRTPAATGAHPDRAAAHSAADRSSHDPGGRDRAAPSLRRTPNRSPGKAA
jgi:hypothetical protein